MVQVSVVGCGSVFLSLFGDEGISLGGMVLIRGKVMTIKLIPYIKNPE